MIVDFSDFYKTLKGMGLVEGKNMRAKEVLQFFEEDPKTNPIEKYPELDALADKLAYDTAMKINKAVEGVKSKMPYKAQYVLEQLIRMLQAKV